METWGEMSSTISYCYYLFVSFLSNFNDLFCRCKRLAPNKAYVNSHRVSLFKHLDNKRNDLKPADGETRSSKGHPL